MESFIQPEEASNSQSAPLLPKQPEETARQGGFLSASFFPIYIFLCLLVKIFFLVTHKTVIEQTNVIIFGPWHYTECGNITSFFIMRGNQAVEVVLRWECFHSRDEILKFPWKYSQSLSCVGVVRNVRLPSKPTF